MPEQDIARRLIEELQPIMVRMRSRIEHELLRA
jgi:hypothetical protein